LSKIKLITLASVLVLGGLACACTPAADESKNAKPATNTAPAAVNANKPAEVAKVEGMPDDVQPIFAAKCKMCHGADAKGFKAAPNILEVKDKHTSAEWVSYLKNPKIWDKDNTMPAPVLTEDEAKKLGDWLAATTGKGAPAADEKKDVKKEGK